MSLHLFEQLTYSEDDWYIMQDAHLKACELLGLDPVSYKNADRLARTIMNSSGERATFRLLLR